MRSENFFIKQGIIYLLFITLSYSHTIEIPVGNLYYRIENFSNYDRINLKNGIFLHRFGSPEIPAVVYSYNLNPHEKVSQIRVVEECWEEVPGNFYIYPEQKRYPLDRQPVFTEPDTTIYNGNNPYPESSIVYYKSGNLRGYSIFQVAIAPFRYLPKSKKLLILRKLVIDVQTISDPSGIKPLRETALSRSIFKKFVSSIVSNPPFPHESSITENPEDLLPLDLPSLLGPPVDLVIITNEPLLLGYERFAQLKRLFGFNTAIRTLTWVRQHYQGVDDAERIRNFLKDAVEKWGTSFALLGGDVPEIPSRWVWLTQIDPDMWPENIITDLYFSDLDGNWNFDGDDRFGEFGDSIDFYPELFVSRLTTETLNEVLGYVEKDYSYLFPLYQGIQIKWLGVTSDLFYPNDALELAQSLGDQLPIWFITTYLNEQPLQSFKDSIYSGFGIIQGIAHGDVNLFKVKSSPREYASNFFFDSLANYSRYALLHIISCYTGPFQSDCLGEHWVNNPTGGGIAYIGPSGTSEGYVHTELTLDLYESFFSYPLAEALGRSKIPSIPTASYDNWYRFYLYSINLLGDPVITIWDSIPRHFDSVSVSPETLNIGIDTISLSLNPPVDSFYVVFYKENDLFLRDSGLSGTMTKEIKTETSGYLKYTIIKRRFVHFVDSVYVNPSIPHLVFNHSRIKDSLNNNNGMINPDEDIFLYIGLKNTGSQATSGYAQIISADTFITIINDTASYPLINPNSLAENLTPFYFKVNKRIPDGHSIEFNIVINYGGFINSDSFQVIASSPDLYLFTQRWNLQFDTVSILPYIENRGHFSADSVRCLIRPLSDTVTILDSIAEFPVILPYSTAGATDSLKILINYPGNIAYNFRLYYRDLEVINKRICLQTPPAPDSFKTAGMKNSIRLIWKSVSGAIGYRIFRSINPQGPFEFLKNPLVPQTLFEDFNALPNTDYYYYISAVDSFMNEGIQTPPIKARVNPMLAQGWPQVVYDHPYASPNFADLDPSYPGLEVVTAILNDGTIYAWHYDGTPVAQAPFGDGRIFVAGGALWTSPAIGDLNGDGIMDIVFGIRRTSNNLYAISLYDTIYLPMPNWPITVQGRIMSAPVLGDLDEDGDLEIVVRTEWADIYVFKYDGTGFFNQTGLLFDGPGNALGAPAVGDVNNDGHLEIVSCGGSWSDSLYVWDRNGNYLSPFPIFIQPEYRLRCAVVLGDVIGDERLEIAFFADSTHKVYLVSPDGVVLWSQNVPYLELIESYPIFADITGDGKPEIICADNKWGILAVFDSLGNYLSGFPLTSPEHEWRKAISCDLDNDEKCEILVPGNDWRTYGYRYDTSPSIGFPIEYGNYITPTNSPAVYDIDLDGKLELMLSPCDFKFYVFDLNTTKFEWPKFRYDQYNSGVYKSKNLFALRELANAESKIRNLKLTVYPNPFRNHLVIHYALWTKHNGPDKRVPSAYSIVPTIRIYDAAGRLVKQWNYQTMRLSDQILWDGTDDVGRNLPSGVYFIRLQCGEFNKTEKAVLLK